VIDQQAYTRQVAEIRRLHEDVHRLATERQRLLQENARLREQVER
jgi:hypothetical protein